MSIVYVEVRRTFITFGIWIVRSNIAKFMVCFEIVSAETFYQKHIARVPIPLVTDSTSKMHHSVLWMQSKSVIRNNVISYFVYICFAF